MRYSKCCVPGCSSLRQDVLLHRFPKDPIILQHWLNSIGCDSLRGLSEEELASLQVCHKHFEQRFVTAKSRIIRTGHPTLFSDEEITTGVPTSHVLNAGIIDLSREHSYSMTSHIDHTYYMIQPSPHAVPHVTSRLDVTTTSSYVEGDNTLISNIETQVKESDVATTSSHFERDNTLISNIETQVNETDVATTSSHFERDNTLISNIETQVNETDIATTSSHFERDNTLISNIETQINKTDVATTSSHFERDNTLISNIETQVNETDVATTSSHFERDNTLISNIETQVNETDVATTSSHFERDNTLISNIETQINKTDVATTSSHFERDNTLISNIETQVNETVLPSQPRMQEKGRKKKLVQTVESLTPKCKVLYREYRKSKKLLNFTRRARKALRFTKEHALDKEIAKLNPLARKVLLMQLRLCTKDAKGRRFSLDEKLIALSIMKQSPKAYRFLQKIFILPSKTTLKKTVQQLNVEPGINPQIFLSIKEEVDTWKDEKKYCSIIFDEMPLEAGLTYTQSKDNITGFVEVSAKKNQFGDHALVFMVKGVVHKWQQTIAYYFCEGATSAPEMKSILKDIVSAVVGTGLIPLVLISDQGTAFQSALSLQEDTRRAQILADENTDNTIQIEGFKLHVIADPPHLIKGVRNNFLTKEVSFEGKRAKWTDIVDVYKTDCQHADMRLLHKLNDEHVIPERIKKMKVKNCARVFSKTMAGALFYTAEFSHYADGKPVSSTLKTTAQVVSFLDDLFDSVNGASLFNKNKKGKELRSAVTETSKHHMFWKDSIKRLSKFKFVDSQGSEKVVPSIKNWMSTLKAFQKLWQFLKNKGIKIMRPRYINSDAIENYFGRVRAYNCRNTSPDSHMFANTFKSLLITGFFKFHRASFNCEDDCSEQLLRINTLFKSLNHTSSLTRQKKRVETSAQKTQADNYSIQDCVLAARKERLNIHARAYTAGWVIRKIFAMLQCDDCKQIMTCDQENEIHTWIHRKEMKSLKQKKLTYPSEQSVRYFGTIVQKTNEFLEINAHKENLLSQIKNDLQEKYDFENLGCDLHKSLIKNAFLTITIRLTIFNWVNVINKIFKGVDIKRLENRNNLPPMQKQALNKFKKKCKRK